MLNPLFPDNEQEKPDEQTSGLDPFRTISRHDKTIEPLYKKSKNESNAAANLIRQKLLALNRKEPDATQEIAEIQDIPKPQSKHQKFMLELSTSGKPLAEIQTAWHAYYAQLPDSEKHEVWQEFYANNAQASRYQQFVEQQHPESPQEKVADHQSAPVGINPNDAGIVVAGSTAPSSRRRSSNRRRD